MNNRRLSLNITSTAPRRQSLTVEGLSSAFKDLAASSGNATGSLRNKAALKPGHSLMGWINLTSTSKDLNGTGGKIIEVTLEELAKHDTEEDCWICIKGNVYNVTAYLQYHPGGVDELMQGVGTDATDLFSEVHSWVNYESILAKCYVGPLKTEPIPVTIPSSTSSTALPPPMTPPAKKQANEKSSPTSVEVKKAKKAESSNSSTAITMKKPQALPEEPASDSNGCNSST